MKQLMSAEEARELSKNEAIEREIETEEYIDSLIEDILSGINTQMRWFAKDGREQLFTHRIDSMSRASQKSIIRGVVHVVKELGYRCRFAKITEGPNPNVAKYEFRIKIKW